MENKAEWSRTKTQKWGIYEHKVHFIPAVISCPLSDIIAQSNLSFVSFAEFPQKNNLLSTSDGFSFSFRTKTEKQTVVSKERPIIHSDILISKIVRF